MTRARRGGGARISTGWTFGVVQLQYLVEVGRLPALKLLGLFLEVVPVIRLLLFSGRLIQVKQRTVWT